MTHKSFRDSLECEIRYPEEYRELVHYTNAAGLSGIVSSGCLWATDASFLNDSEEIRHFFGHRLVDLVRSEKPVKTYHKNGMPIPYIELFAKTKDVQVPHKLPIKEVIIGPHPDSGRRKAAVKQPMEANGYSVEVVCSEIPYIGR